jgi:hypothetical protein
MACSRWHLTLLEVLSLGSHHSYTHYINCRKIKMSRVGREQLAVLVIKLGPMQSVLSLSRCFSRFPPSTSPITFGLDTSCSPAGRPVRKVTAKGKQ